MAAAGGRGRVGIPRVSRRSRAGDRHPQGRFRRGNASKDEFDQRVGQAFGSRTGKELAGLTADLRVEPVAARSAELARPGDERPVLRPGPVLAAATALYASVWGAGGHPALASGFRGRSSARMNPAGLLDHFSSTCSSWPSRWGTCSPTGFRSAPTGGHYGSFPAPGKGGRWSASRTWPARSTTGASELHGKLIQRSVRFQTYSHCTSDAASRRPPHSAPRRPFPRRSRGPARASPRYRRHRRR